MDGKKANWLSKAHLLSLLAASMAIAAQQGKEIPDYVTALLEDLPDVIIVTDMVLTSDVVRAVSVGLGSLSDDLEIAEAGSAKSTTF